MATRDTATRTARGGDRDPWGEEPFQLPSWTEKSRPTLNRSSSVAALIPHFQCEEWLADCLESLAEQTRPLDAIYVIHDGPAPPPARIVSRFPAVTLLAAKRNVGPYRLIQQVIDDTDFDAYLFQDADDWSSRDRLAVLLAEAERVGAELVGSQEVRILCDDAEAIPYCFPLDANAMLDAKPFAFALLHPTSLVSRDLVQRVGGFATGMRFGGDSEFLKRAAHIGRVVNVPRYCYHRRKRAGSLTMDPSTGLQSVARRALYAELSERTLRNAAAVAEGREPDLAPYRVADPVELSHILGPPLGARRPRVAAPREPAAAPRPPIFVIGPPRSGAAVLGLSLGQHPDIQPLFEAGWLGKLAVDVADAYLDGCASGSRGQLHVMGATRASFLSAIAATVQTALGSSLGFAAATIGQAAGANPAQPVQASPESARAGRWVDFTPENAFYVAALLELFPGARVIHVVRDLDEVVDSLVNLAAGDSTYFREDSACECWVRTVEACLEVERAFGGDRVHRVRYADLLRSPEREIRRCLDFVGEQFDPACLRVLHGVSPIGRMASLNEMRSASTGAARAAGRRMSATLLAATPEVGPASRDSLSNLRRSVAARRHAASPAAPAEEGPSKPIRHLRQVVADVVPPSSTVIVVSRGDEQLLRFTDRVGWHFPRTDDGTYAGHHPGSSAEAIAHLELLRSKGGDYLLFPCTALWWLREYPDFAEYLRSTHQLAYYKEDVGLIFALRAAGRIETAPARAVPLPIPA